MSRRSLRLDDSLLDRSLPHSSASFSGGGASWRSTRSLKSRHSQQLSLSCSQSLLLNTPRKLTTRPLLNSSLHSEVSDASLLSLLLDDSSVKENKLVNSLWGLDPDADPKESTIIAEQSTVLEDHTLIGAGGCCSKHLVQTLSGVCCEERELPRDRAESSHCLPSKCTTPCSSSCVTAPGPSEPRDPETSIYYRELGRRSSTGRPGHSGIMSLKESVTNQECHPDRALCKISDVYSRLCRRWPHMTSSVLLTWLPLSLLLLLLSLCWFGPAALHSILPAVCISDWSMGAWEVSGFNFPQSQSAEGPEVLLNKEPPLEEAAAADESGRLDRLEHHLTALWDWVEARQQQVEQRHREVLQLYADLQQQQQQVNCSESCLEQRLEQLRTQLQEERWQREQAWVQQQDQKARLDQLELLLKALAARLEEAASPFPATLPAAVSVYVEGQSHNALLAEVARLEAALKDIQQDVKGSSVCREHCRHLEGIQERISEQVHDQVHTLVYGNQRVVRDGPSAEAAAPPQSLLQWLSQQYVSKVEVQASLAALELNFLQNISLELQQNPVKDAVREDILPSAGAAVTRQDVHVIVENALRRFSQDRTGLADYALESGGGSVLSTRCSETYETKAALLSLFGVPLWHFSQSPRAVIQPDVHPGNCWAFRGSRGFLVIRLSMRILPTAFSLEHIPKVLAPSGTLPSAPRDFSVYGLDNESQEGGELLGTYTYSVDGEALQTFTITDNCDRAYQIIEVQVLSNWGHPEYTCMYRFRVHGTPM